MSSTFLQAQAEGLCLRYPEKIPPQREITYESAVNMLLRAISMAQNIPFTWGFVDKPSDGTILLLFLPHNSPFPIDGIRFQEAEVKFTLPAGPRELEVQEVKFGFIPGSQDTNASRVRRRYRLQKGGHSQLVLVHYTRGPATHIQQAFMNQPVRAYPLRTVNEPSVYVTGEKAGTKVYPPGGPQMHGGAGGPASMPPTTIGLGMNLNQQQAMIAQQNNTMESLERRRERERERERARDRTGGTTGRPPQRVEEDDSGDEVDQISTRTLAIARYKHNHDWMNEVFCQAAYPNKTTQPQTSPYSIFSKIDIEEKTVGV
ncbi:hypothetical protein BYT27DRAFT_7121926 [Phlegmacium glaucopus]|nr:hypothetical protein BYT27DRAFT_7121926 [Phlegmacium glaucopus]